MVGASPDGGNRDGKSVMHPPPCVQAIKEPAQYAATGIARAGGLSAEDSKWIQSFYPGRWGYFSNAENPATLLELKHKQMW
jgi:hypothetical protein